MTNKPSLSPWEYYNKDKKGYGLVYQLVVSLGKPFRILSFNGPFKGAAADVSILRSTVYKSMREDEMVMCDKSYRFEAKCWCPPEGEIDSLSNEEKYKRREVTRIRHIVERVIGRLKMWGIFSKKWNKGWRLHKLCANAAARLSQLELHAFPLT